MGLRNFGSLIIIFVILMMVFGTKRLREVGNDLAVAIRNFRKALQEDPDEKLQPVQTERQFGVASEKQKQSQPLDSHLKQQPHHEQHEQQLHHGQQPHHELRPESQSPPDSSTFSTTPTSSTTGLPL